MNTVLSPNHTIEDDYVVISYKGFIPFDEFTEICLKALEIVKDTGIDKFLSDTSEMKVMPKENQEWIQNEWFPMAMQTKLRRVAFLVPNSAFGKASVEATNSQAQQAGNITIRNFTNREEAIQWLKEA